MLLLLLHDIVSPGKLLVALFLDVNDLDFAGFLRNDFIISLDHLCRLLVTLLELYHRQLKGLQLRNDLNVELFEALICCIRLQIIHHLDQVFVARFGVEIFLYLFEKLDALLHLPNGLLVLVSHVLHLVFHLLLFCLVVGLVDVDFGDFSIFRLLQVLVFCTHHKFILDSSQLPLHGLLDILKA